MTTATMIFLALLGSGMFLQTRAQSVLEALFAVEKSKAEGKSPYYAAVNADVVPQLRLTADESTAACRNISGETARETAHPYTCSAFLTCYEYNGPNHGIVYVRPLSAGLFWSADNTNERAVPEATCRRNPCKTGIPISDGQNCFSYITCVTGTSTMLETKKCANGTSFSYSQASVTPNSPCVTDTACYQYTPPVSRLVACTPIGDLQRGITEYNRTQQLTYYDGRQEISSLTLKCPADTVLDVTDLANCTCVPSNNRSCPLVLEQSPKSIRFDIANTNLVEIPGLASNEIAGNFILSFSFQVSGSVTNAGLVSNARNTVNCQGATIEVYIENSNVVASLKPVVSSTSVTLRSTIQISAGVTYSVQLTRNGSTAALTVNNSQVSSDIGTSRLAKTNCGLSLGQGYPRGSFQGTIENLRITLPCV